MKKFAKCFLSAALLIAVLCGCALFSSCKKDDSVFDSDAKYFENAIYYSDFGAKGDGTTDDFDAIKSAHAYANENRLPVKADDGATYFIAPHESTVTVKTSTDWGNAKFIIDDKSASEDGQVWWYPLFDIRPDQEGQKIDLPEGYTLAAGQQNVGFTFDDDMLLYLVNKNKKDFVRYGVNQDGGDNRQEIILVDEMGNVNESTPILRDYAAVTQMTAYSVAETKILLRGGEFTTIANDDSTVRHYFNRGLDVRRSNTVVKNVKHYVTDEGSAGSPYNGFFRANYAHNVIFENCVMTGHKTYQNSNGVNQGTYDTRLHCCNAVTYRNCTQYNATTDKTYWGIMCSDYCKNLLMEDCKLSRFDAHHGVHNATIRNCELGQNVSVVGSGLFLMENTVRICPQGTTGCNRFLTLRADYGSFWNGEVVLRNCTLKTYTGLNYVIDAGWANWNFGFPCCFPKNVTLENVKIEHLADIKNPRNYVFSFITETDGQTEAFMQASVNPVVLTEKVTVINCSTVFQLTANKMGWFSQTALIQ